MGGEFAQYPHWLDDLGRWSAKVSLSYVRSQLRRVSRIQAEVAHAIRNGGLSLKDVGEDEMLSSWILFMCLHSIPSQVALEQAMSVASLSILLLRGSSDACPYSESGAVVRSEDELAVETDMLQASAEANAPSKPTVPEILPGTYVISVQRRTNMRRLHIQGRCPYRAGVDFANFEVAGLDEPASSRYTARCKKCLRGAVTAFASDVDSSVET